MSKKKKHQKPLNYRKWNKQIKIFHNKGSKHFLLVIALRGNYVAGHDLTTHPSLNKDGNPKKKYLKLYKNPNPSDKRNSYLDKHLRINIRINFDDTGRKRLIVKRKWKISKRDKKIIKRMDRNKL